VKPLQVVVCKHRQQQSTGSNRSPVVTNASALSDPNARSLLSVVLYTLHDSSRGANGGAPGGDGGKGLGFKGGAGGKGGENGGNGGEGGSGGGGEYGDGGLAGGGGGGCSLAYAYLVLPLARELTEIVPVKKVQKPVLDTDEYCTPVQSARELHSAQQSSSVVCTMNGVSPERPDPDASDSW